MITFTEIPSKATVELHTLEVAYGLNTLGNLPLSHDQTKGNACHMLTLYVFQRLMNEGLLARRELHMIRENGELFWHFMLAHAEPDRPPSNDDIISDLNPWQWGGCESGILYGSREDVMNTLKYRGAPESFVALRGLNTLLAPHDLRKNPFAKTIN